MADHMHKPPLGSGERFRALVRKIMSRGMSRERAEAIAASVGRKKFGKERFQKLAAAGLRRALKRRKS